MKNIVFLMDIDLKGEGRYSSSRRLPYKYSIKSWKHWCEKNNAELFILEDPLLPTNSMKICWQRYYLFDILEANEIEYNQIAMVDADTIVHPDCPNFFESTENKFCAAEFDSSWDWVIRSIENYSLFSFDNFMMPIHKYFDCGFMVVNKTHKEFFSQIIDFYTNNSETLKELEKLHVGTDQTPVNMLIHKLGIDLKLLPYEYNTMDMTRKEILGEDLVFTKVGNIFQFNCLPNNENNQAQLYWMEKTYKHLYEN
jgi:hypothetical protein